MWHLLKTEILYQKKNMFLFFIISFFVMAFAIAVHRPYLAHFIPFYMATFTPYSLLINANKEHRNRLFVSLPLTLRSLACYRMMLLLLSLVWYSLLFFGFYALAYTPFLVPIRHVVTFSSFAVLLYAFSYLIRDLFREGILRKNITREKVAPFLILLLILIQVWLAYALIVSRTGKTVYHIGNLVDWLVVNFPFAGQWGFVKALIPAFVLGCISIFTLEQSKVRY